MAIYIGTPHNKRKRMYKIREVLKIMREKHG
jgi:hypothetical protein